MHLTRRIASFRRLPSAERRAVRSAWRLLWLLRVAIYVRSVPDWRVRLRAAASGMTRANHPKGVDVAPVRMARLVDTAAKYVWPSPSCLHRSLVLEALLSAQGVSVDVRFGVRRRAGTVEAHAWVEYNGDALTPPDDERARQEPFVPARSADEP